MRSPTSQSIMNISAAPWPPALQHMPASPPSAVQVGPRNATPALPTKMPSICKTRVHDAFPRRVILLLPPIGPHVPSPLPILHEELWVLLSRYRQYKTYLKHTCSGQWIIHTLLYAARKPNPR